VTSPMTSRALILVASLPLAACGRASHEAAAAADAAAAAETATPVASTGRATLEGRVVRVGPDPVTWLALVLPDRSQRRLIGAAADPLCSVLGATVTVDGVHEAGGIRLESFRVVEVDRQPVDDGTIVATTGGAALRLPSGATRDIPNAPDNLRAAAGARAWVSHPVAGVAPSFGVIDATCR
jgi:hypothetical protein